MSVIRPYRVLEADQLVLGPWKDISGGVIEESTRFQVGVDLQIHCQVDLDLFKANYSLFNDEAPTLASQSLEWVVEWFSSKTKLGGVTSRTAVSNQSQILNVTLPGDLIGDRIEITRKVVLSSDVTIDFALAPRRKGSIVWSDEFQFRIEGVGGQMPITFISFEENGLNRNAVWTIDISKPDSLTEESFDEPFPEHLRILLNSGSPMSRQIAAATSLEDPAIVFILRTLARDSLAAMIDLATAESFDSGRRYATGTLGHQLSTALKLAGISNVEEFRSRSYMAQMALIQGAVYR